ncbi:MAG: family acetyltransferase [Anaerocolumna sp.]|nr:family acetyltransferase [Anaerocolumna sp.]
MEQINCNNIQIKLWESKDIDLLIRINEPEMMENLGGSETKEQVMKRHNRYLDLKGKGCMFSIILYPDLESVGSIGYWQSDWNGEDIFEIGWSILPPFQGKGIATIAAKLAVGHASAENKYNYIHAFPSIKNPASNAICRKLGFDFISECDFEYPPGSIMRCNNWRLRIKNNEI